MPTLSDLRIYVRIGDRAVELNLSKQRPPVARRASRDSQPVQLSFDKHEPEHEEISNLTKGNFRLFQA